MHQHGCAPLRVARRLCSALCAEENEVHVISRMSIRFSLVALIALLLGACISWPGGNDPGGLKAKKDVEAVIAAANAYRDRYGEYPKSLSSLGPEFISTLPSHIALQYHRSKGEIAFIYSPSTSWGGAAKCETSIETVNWVCTDYKL